MKYSLKRMKQRLALRPFTLKRKGSELKIYVYIYLRAVKNSLPAKILSGKEPLVHL